MPGLDVPRPAWCLLPPPRPPHLAIQRPAGVQAASACTPLGALASYTCAGAAPVHRSVPHACCAHVRVLHVRSMHAYYYCTFFERAGRHVLCPWIHRQIDSMHMDRRRLGRRSVSGRSMDRSMHSSRSTCVAGSSALIFVVYNEPNTPLHRTHVPTGSLTGRLI